MIPCKTAQNWVKSDCSIQEILQKLYGVSTSTVVTFDSNRTVTCLNNHPITQSGVDTSHLYTTMTPLPHRESRDSWAQNPPKKKPQNCTTAQGKRTNTTNNKVLN